MNDRDFNKKLLTLMEDFYPMGMNGPAEQEESENVSYSKTKSKGDARVTISANAKSMQELHDVLKLAGITLPKNDDQDDKEDHKEPEMDREEGEPCPQCGAVDCDCPPGECDCEPVDDKEGEPEIAMIKNPSYSTDKDVLMGMLKDKLAKHLS